ncbi:MAG: DNA cytosine methyltransferase [Bacillota bacterium]|nr:DNA cytosine methyltransferase [Bacillota bacterium]
MPNYVIDLFSGAGGLTEGFAREGFDIITHIEKDPWACETLRTRVCYHWLKENNRLDIYNNYLRSTVSIKKNAALKEEIIYSCYPELNNLVKNRVLNKTFGNTLENPDTISSGDAIRYISNIARQNGVQSISTVIGGPPCQAYSLIGRGRMKEQASTDDRNFLFKFYLDIVNEFKPKLFVFENVPGILSAQNGQLFPAIREEFDRIGYGFVSGPNASDQENIINCKDYGVYQPRRRLILFGYRIADYPQGFTYPDFAQFMVNLDEPMNTANAISDLPHLLVGQGSDFWYREYDHNRELSRYQSMMREGSPGVLNHFARPHRTDDLEIYALQIDASLRGEKISYSQLPERLQLHKNSGKKVFEDRFRVHGSQELPHTIVAHISKDGHYNIHPDPNQRRSLTVREAARIQSFPDNYFFEGPRTAQFVQVGNAVPPLLSHIIAMAVRTELEAAGNPND